MPNFLMGTPGGFERVKRFRPGQEAGFEQMLSQGLAGLGGGAPSFEPIRERAMKTFQEDVVPSLAERFTGAGARRSSGFQEALAKGGTDLASTLAAMESQFGQQRFGNLMQMLGAGLTPQEETVYFGAQPGFLGGLAPGIGAGAGGLLSALPGAIGTYMGGAAGGAAGGPLGGAGGAAAGGALGAGASKFIQFLMSLFQKSQQGGRGGGVSMDPSQNPVYGSNII